MVLVIYTSLIPFRNSNFTWFYVPTGEVKENKILFPSNSSKGETNLIARRHASFESVKPLTCIFLITWFGKDGAVAF